MDQETALGRLRADHKEVSRRLEELLVNLDSVSDPADPDTAIALRNALEFITHEVWFHFKREEQALFPAISRVFPAENAPIVGGPVYVLTEEHGVLRKLVDRFADEVDHWEAGAPGAPEAVRLAGKQLVRAFQKHIYKEDNIVFRLTQQMLTPDELAAIDVAFAAVQAP
ncbi:MAG TPA: hemerythrin domain-containing protein [Armatimonadota bacterium]|jgi:hemerythrin-like domain-containing protein